MSGASSAGQTRTQASILIPRGSVSLTLSRPHDPETFYQTRDDLYVLTDFRDRIVAKATPSAAGTTYNVSIAELGESATDQQIKAALPESYRFHESAVCAIVAEMVGKQQNGEPGDLEHTGHANLFYTASHVVYVLWETDSHEWSVLAWNRSDYGWDAGDRAVSPA